MLWVEPARHRARKKGRFLKLPGRSRCSVACPQNSRGAWSVSSMLQDLPYVATKPFGKRAFSGDSTFSPIYLQTRHNRVLRGATAKWVPCTDPSGGAVSAEAKVVMAFQWVLAGMPGRLKGRSIFAASNSPEESLSGTYTSSTEQGNSYNSMNIHEEFAVTFEGKRGTSNFSMGSGCRVEPPDGRPINFAKLCRPT